MICRHAEGVWGRQVRRRGGTYSVVARTLTPLLCFDTAASLRYTTIIYLRMVAGTNINITRWLTDAGRCL